MLDPVLVEIPLWRFVPPFSVNMKYEMYLNMKWILAKKFSICLIDQLNKLKPFYMCTSERSQKPKSLVLMHRLLSGKWAPACIFPSQCSARSSTMHTAFKHRISEGKADQHCSEWTWLIIVFSVGIFLKNTGKAFLSWNACFNLQSLTEMQQPALTSGSLLTRVESCCWSVCPLQMEVHVMGFFFTAQGFCRMLTSARNVLFRGRHGLVLLAKQCILQSVPWEV